VGSKHQYAIHQSRRPVGLVLVALLIGFFMPKFALRASAGARDLSPINFGVAIADTGLASFGGIVDLPSRRQVLLISPDDNRLAIHRYDGSEQFSRVVGERPVSGVVLNNQLYVIFQGLTDNTGTLARVDPATLTATPVVSGMNVPQGLTKIGNWLYTTVLIDSSSVFRNLIRIDPTTLATVIEPPFVRDGVLAFVSLLIADPLDSNRLYFIGSLFPHIVSALNIADRYAEIVADADSIAFVQGEMVTVAHSYAPGWTMLSGYPMPSGTDWRPQDRNGAATVAVAAASSDQVLAVWARDSSSRSFVSLSSVKNRLPQIGEVTIPGGEPLLGGMLVTQDSSRVMVVSALNGHILVTTVGGASSAGAPQAQGGVAPRSAAPQAPTQAASTAVRSPAPQTGRPVVQQRSVADIEFDGAGRGFVADPLTNSVNIYNPDGSPFTAIENVDRVASLVVHRGEMLAYVAGKARLATLSTSSSSFELRCPSAGTGLISMNNELYVGEWLRLIDPTTCVETGFGADLLSRNPITFDEGVVPAGLLSGNARFDPLSKQWSYTTTGIVFRAAVPGLNTAIDSRGRRYDALTFAPDGTVFEGDRFAVSYENPRWVAATTGEFAAQISMYAYEGGGLKTPVSTVNFPSGSGVARMEFQPVTGSLWVALRDSSGKVSIQVIQRSSFGAPVPSPSRAEASTGNGSIASVSLSPAPTSVAPAAEDTTVVAAQPSALEEPPSTTTPTAPPAPQTSLASSVKTAKRRLVVPPKTKRRCTLFKDAASAEQRGRKPVSCRM
jgi:hypothetical protein